MRGVSQQQGRRHRSSIIGDSLQQQAEMERSSSTSTAAAAAAVYRDFSGIGTDAILKIVVPPKAKRKGPRGGVQTPFPTRLFDMLEASHKEGLEHIVSWQPHGRSFIVRKPALFEARLLPR